MKFKNLLNLSNRGNTVQRGKTETHSFETFLVHINVAFYLASHSLDFKGQTTIDFGPYSYAYGPYSMYFQNSELNVKLTTFPSVSKDCEGQMQPQKLLSLSRTMTNLFILNLSALHEKEGENRR